MLLQAACDAIDVLVATRSSPWPDQACRSPGQRATHRLASANLPQFSGIGIRSPRSAGDPLCPRQSPRPSRPCSATPTPRSTNPATPCSLCCAFPRSARSRRIAQDCRRAAEWWREQLTGLGFRTEILPTPGHPVVVGHHDGPGRLQRPARLVLRALRRAAGRSAGAVAQPAVRAAARRRPARQALRRARRGGRQGPVGDVPGSAARLAHRRRRHPRAPDRADRGRGRSRQRQPGTLRRGA